MPLQVFLASLKATCNARNRKERSVKANKTAAISSGIAALLAAVSLAAAPGEDSVIGYWRLVKSERANPDSSQKPSPELEMRFAGSGLLLIKFRDQTAATNGTRMAAGKFTLIPPDRLTMSLNSEAEEHYRYSITTGQLRLEHLDLPITNTFKRLKEFSL
jgi:hypothetical protein